MREELGSCVVFSGLVVVAIGFIAMGYSLKSVKALFEVLARIEPHEVEEYLAVLKERK